MKDITRKLNAVLASPKFFYAILGFFVLNALWFVCSALYPMAFDEDFHLGAIRIYAQQWSPFLTSQPPSGDTFGALAADPSYFFHYVMSFPLRFVQLFTDNETAQVIVLRLINVALFTWSIVLYRRILLRAKASSALANGILAIFVLIPIVPQLAAHINYDNALMVLFAWLCLLVFRLTDSFRQKRVDVQALLLFVIVCLFTSIVKYAALPLLVGAVLFLAYVIAHSYKGHWRQLWKGARGGFVRLSTRAKIILLAALFVGLGLFAQRYVVNTIKYHTPVPDCGQVLTVDQCKQYGPWGRDYKYEHQKSAAFRPNILSYIGDWSSGMLHRLFFAVSGAKTRFANYIELPVPVSTFTVLFFAGLLAVGVWFKRIFAGQPYVLFFGITTATYLVFLFYDQYSMYAKTAMPVAINGRYLLPVLPLAGLIVARGLSYALAAYKIEHLKPYLATAVILLFLQGGGFLTYLLRADTNWYWPNKTVRIVNKAARTVISPFIIEGDKYKFWP